MKRERVIELAQSDFSKTINDEKTPLVVIDFFADWCMPCVMMGPIVDELSEKFNGKIKFGKVNIEDNQAISNKFGIRSIPNFILFKDGKQIANFVGAIPEEDFEDRLNKFLK